MGVQPAEVQRSNTPPPESNDPIVLVTGGDNAFAFAIGVMLHSAIKNLADGDSLHIYILDGGIDDENKARINRIAASPRASIVLTWLAVDFTRLQHLPSTAWHKRAAYMRLLIPELLPASVEKLIYLDCDVIIERSLRDLWNQELAGALSLGVENFSDRTVASPNALPETYEQLGIPASAAYCNTGVMVINLRRWRDEQVSERILEFTHRFADNIRFADQDGINAITAGDWGILDARWNVQILTISVYKAYSELSWEEQLKARAELIATPFIIHYTGKVKPWEMGYRQPRGERFLFYAASSGWFEPLHTLTWFSTRYASQKVLRNLVLIKHAAIALLAILPL